MKPAIVIAITFLSVGCQAKFPGITISAFGTAYQHEEWVDHKTQEIKKWKTEAFRSWGTSRLNTRVTMSSESIGIEGEGISERMAGVVTEIGSKALCTVPAIAPSCIAGAFAPTNEMSNEQAIALFKESFND